MLDSLLLSFWLESFRIVSMGYACALLVSRAVTTNLDPPPFWFLLVHIFRNIWTPRLIFQKYMDPSWKMWTRVPPCKLSYCNKNFCLSVQMLIIIYCYHKLLDDGCCWGFCSWIYFLEFFPQVLLISECASMRIHSREETIWARAETIIIATLPHSCAHCAPSRFSQNEHEIWES